MVRLITVTLLALLLGATGARAAGPGELFPALPLALPDGGLAAAHSGESLDESYPGELSADGRYVAFVSDADTLDPAAALDVSNVFRKDRTTGAVVLVSRGPGADGAGVIRGAIAPQISGDGNRIAFLTEAPLVPGDADTENDAYLRDLSAQTTTLLTPDTTLPVTEVDLSADGFFVALSTSESLVVADANTDSDVYRVTAAGQFPVLVSRNSGGAAAGNGFSYDPVISGDGRWVAFASGADDLVTGYTDGGGGSNVYARDVTDGVTYLVSSKNAAVATGANGDSNEPAIAGTPGDATEVVIAFTSTATDITPADTNSNTSVFRRDLGASFANLMSRATTGSGANADGRAAAPAITADGQLVAFNSDATNLGAGDDYYGVYVRAVGPATTTLGSARNAYSVVPALAADGSYLTWVDQSGADAPDGDPDLRTVLGRAWPGGATELVSRPAGTVPYLAPVSGTESAEPGQRLISADGRYVVFEAYASRLYGSPVTQIVRRDTRTGDVVVVSRASGADGAVATRTSTTPSISADGTRVAFRSFAALDPADGDDDDSAIYVRDLATNTTILAGRVDGADGAVANGDAFDPRISAGGRHVAFGSDAANLGAPAGDDGVFWRDLDAGVTKLVSRATGAAGAVAAGDVGSVSGDGRLVTFESGEFTLDPADPGPDIDADVFVRDTSTDETRLVSRRPGLDGADSSGSSVDGVVSTDGTKVAFLARDAEVAPEAGAWTAQQLVRRDLATGENTLVSRAPGGAAADEDVSDPALDAAGATVAFQSAAQNLAPVDGDDRSVFVRAPGSGAITRLPGFGFDDGGFGSYAPSLSDDGQCLAFTGYGHNAFTGPAGDFRTTYVYVVSGTCPKPAPAEPAPSASPSPSPSATPSAPRLTGVSMTRRRFRVGKGKTAQSAAKRGTAFRFTLSDAATTTVRIEQRLKGRRKGGKCVKPRKGLKKRCTRYRARHRLTRALPAGAARVTYSGRVGKRRLRPGRYRATLRAANDAGRSAAVRLTFRVVRR